MTLFLATPWEPEMALVTAKRAGMVVIVNECELTPDREG